MRKLLRSLLCSVVVMLPLSAAHADEYRNALEVFKAAGESGRFFDNSYGYALFPTVTKAGFMVGGAYGEGRVYEQGRYVGNTTMTQGSIGLQLGAQAFSQIIFFRDERALSEFTNGNFEFGAEASAIGITAGASAQATTTGSSTSTSRNQGDAHTRSRGYYKGMAIFTVAKGGLMFQATVGGQKFRYTPVR
ncbi:MAG: lipid-binding SYLF domain-containing protein [Gammaproteobacteria bacterium]|nr:lipid-binding SYLF domain-containing protein [Gammaproteobacteria bacterium]